MGVEDNQKDKKNSKIFVSVQIRSAALLACVGLIRTVATNKKEKNISKLKHECRD